MTDTKPLAPTDAELDELRQANSGKLNFVTFSEFRTIARAVLAKWGAPQQEAQESCPTCIALARTVMLDQVSFDRKPDCYGIRQITDDEGVEEWEDIRTSPDVAREEANDMMATDRGEIYEVVPLWTTPQPAPATQQEGERFYAFRRKGMEDFCTCDEARYEELSNKPHLFETRIFYTAPQPSPTLQADSVLEDAARLEQRSQPSESEGMTIAGNGASELGKLMREQRALRGGFYPDGTPNTASKQGANHD